jgi:CBS domain-containing protein
MLALKDLMTPAPVTINPGATLRDAVELLTKVGVNALPVTEGDHIVGILSAQSIITFESTTPGVPTERNASDAWDSVPPEEEDLPSAAYFTELWDDAGIDVEERFRVTDSPEWDFLSEHLVEEAMVFDPPQFSPEATVDEAAQRMRSTGAHGVLVVESGKLCGIVTTMDITRAFSQQSQSDIE